MKVFKNRLIMLMLAVVMVLGETIIVSAQDEQFDDSASVAYANFGMITDCSKLTASMGTKSGINAYNENGHTGWILKEATAANSQINIDLDSAFAYKNTNGTSYTIEIDYLDLENGHFNVMYDSYDMPNKETKITYIGNTGEWKTAVYELDDAYFGNRTDSGWDLRITTIDQALTRGGSANVVIGAVRITAYNAKNFVQVLSVETDAAGNIFGNGEEQKFIAEIINHTDKAKTTAVKFEALDKDEHIIWSYDTETTIDGGDTKSVSAVCNVDEYGLFYMRVTARGDGFEHIKNVPFSLVNNRLDGKKHSLFGYQNNFTSNVPGYEYDYKKGLEVYDKSGISFIRMNIVWNQVDPYNKRKYTCEITDQYKEIFDGIAAYNFDVTLNIGLYGPNKYDGLLSTTHMPITEDAMKGFAEFCKFNARVCKERGIKVQGYEIWNESELSHFNKNATMKQSSEIAVNAAKAISEVDPDAAQKTSPSFCAGPYVDTYTQGLSADGYADWCQALIWHTYHNNSYPEEQRTMIYAKDYIEKYEETLGKKPANVLLTETGRNRSVAKSKDPLDRAKLIMRDLVFIQKSGLIDKVSMYTIHNFGREDHGEDTYGDLASPNAAITDVPFAATEGFVAKANYNNLMCEAEYERMLADDETGKNAYLFKRPDDSLMTVWSANRNKKYDTLSFKSDAESVNVYDMYGNAQQVYGNNGIFSLCITDQIQYIVGDIDDAQLCENPFEIENYQESLSGESQLSIELKGIQPGLDISVKDNDNVKYLSQSREKNNTNAKIKLKIIGNADEKNTIDLCITKENKICYIYNLPIEITESILCSVNAFPVSLNDASQWNLKFNLSNQKTGSVVSGDIEVIEPTDWADKIGKYKFKEIPGNSIGVAETTVTRHGTDRSAYLKYKVCTDNGQEYYFANSINFDAGLYANTAPEIDGKLSDGEWYPSFALVADKATDIYKFTENWGGVNDLSAKIMFEIDENNVYIGADITDDVMSAKSSDDQIWRNDSIQFGVAYSDSSKESEYYGDTFTEIAIADSPEGAIAWRHKSFNNALPACKVESAKVAVKREGQHTYYEACIPLSEIFGTAVDGSTLSSIKFSAVVNDDDGNGRKQAIQIGGGIVSVKDLKQFRNLNILKFD